ncbi:YdiU family protein [Elizabethkingia argentiflava]|uniref:Protein nucleotidyltransferase YdiU n=1 Tax=Elizabethkingia argenteiflava TaxID=2681556 RepID=A0A845PUP7_9FLAO|nr:YdiU family protein [Elizabethkingia argenteiflava]NAW50616.1 YdiU family protein [Elizabethkingia argenteiflava]
MPDLPEIRQPFKEAFPGDYSFNNYPRHTPHVLHAVVEPMNSPHPQLILFNDELGKELKISRDHLDFFSAQRLPQKLQLYATVYAGHQFGNWAGQLGDGRVMNIGEMSSLEGKALELQYKGAGSTPYSRNADGRAVFRSSLREYLMSEAMHYLGVPTTRALSLVKTGEEILRDILYQGDPQMEEGAMIIRTAESFIRFGHFELLAARQDWDLLRQLIDWTIKRYFPQIKGFSKQQTYLLWFREVSQNIANMLVEWYRVGFVHGVMNTDNMSILGLTIDYGPFSMLDEYDLNFTPNTTDLPTRRYAFGKQANIAHWNLVQLAHAIFPIINEASALEGILEEFSEYFWQQYDQMMARKLGLDELKQDDQPFLLECQKLMSELNLDYTLFFSLLEKVDQQTPVLTHFAPCLYDQLEKSQKKQLQDFIQRYITRKQDNKISRIQSLEMMQKANPKFILRNYLLFEAIKTADAGDFKLLDKLVQALKLPYQELYPEFSVRRPEGASDQPGACMLSCSS